VDSTNSVTQIKSDLRKRFRADREFLVVDSSWEHLLEASEVKKALVVASYFSYGDEPNTRNLNQTLISLGKKLLLPRLRDDKDLDWVIWSGRNEDLISKGLVHEAVGDLYVGDIDVVIVPALHVDRQGNRLGQGGGSYDRTLARTKAWKVALVYPGELTSEEVPREVHDQRVDAAATTEILVRFTEAN
jgi:5-formyltetrahydrofolate cyclo-ligase